MSDQTTTVLYKVVDGVAVITLNRPKQKNALNQQIRSELLQFLIQAKNDLAVKTIVLTGNGGAFSAGQDLAEEIAGGVPTQLLMEEEYRPIIFAIDQSEKLVIAAVDGAVAWAKEIAQKAPLAVRDSKRALKESQNTDLHHAYSYEASLQSVVTASDDAKEGIRAFVEKREPVFKGE